MQPLVRAENLVKRYGKNTLTGLREDVAALDGVSFAILPGTTLGIVGESGSGKSTLSLCLAGLEYPTSGCIWFEGKDLVQLTEKDRRRVRPMIQLIFQDPANSLNQRWSVLEILKEPLILQKKCKLEEIKQRAESLLELVGLSAVLLGRSPAEMSGGQRQRLAIARALALEPKLLILDEALSALDCSTQAQVANLLMELQSTLGMAYLLITHDLAMAAHLADEIAVMNRGRIVEQGSSERVIRQPQHDITRQLLEAVPTFDRASRRAIKQ